MTVHCTKVCYLVDPSDLFEIFRNVPDFYFSVVYFHLDLDKICRSVIFLSTAPVDSTSEDNSCVMCFVSRKHTNVGKADIICECKSMRVQTEIEYLQDVNTHLMKPKHLIHLLLSTQYCKWINKIASSANKQWIRLAHANASGEIWRTQHY